ncbi:MAG: hypothetical protein FJZ01_23565 [Candidatus Sericytochromatia bacterium]|nr:hypothetical protein [Candidatus Tanganyikabacteria bacterium]
MMGMMGDGHMMGMGMQDWSSGLEVRYLPGFPVITPTTTLTSSQAPAYVIGGLDVRNDMGMMGLGGQLNVAAQVGNLAGAGSWIVPHVGLMPRIGLGLGPLRLEAGLLGGVGAMLRQASTQGGAYALEVKGTWVLEPRIEVGIKGNGISAAVVGTFLASAVPSELGGLTGGIRVSFGGAQASSEVASPDASLEHSGHGH